MIKRQNKIVTTSLIGNTLEWFDFSIYAFLAPIITLLFFPTTSPPYSLLPALAVFAVGFILRPFSSLVFGYIGDKFGRKNALLLSSGLLAFSTTLMGLLPTYHTIGYMAGILLLLSRLAQGIAVGGEIGFSIYIVEHAPQNKQGLYGSIPVVSCMSGFLLSSFVIMELNNLLTHDQLLLWGWRIPFLMSSLLGFVTVYFRLYMPETPYFLKLKKSNQLEKNTIIQSLLNWKMLIKAGLISSLAFVSFGIFFIYLPSYLTVYLDIPSHDTLLLNVIGIITMIMITPLFAFFSDKIGRKTLLYLASYALIFITFPLFNLLNNHSFLNLLVIHIIFAMIVSLSYAPLMVYLVELFRTSTRYTSIGIAFNIASVLFGGFTPFFADWVIALTHSHLAPAILLVMVGILGITLLSSMKETL